MTDDQPTYKALYQFYNDITIYVYYKIDIDTFFNELKNVEMTNLLASIPNDKVNNTKKLTFQKNDTTRLYFSQRQIDDLNDNGYVKVFDHTIYLHDLTAQQHFPINKNIKQDKHHVTPVTPTNANDIYKQKAARFLFTWKYLKNKRYANLNIDIQHAFAFASIDTTYVKKYLDFINEKSSFFYSNNTVGKYSPDDIGLFEYDKKQVESALKSGMCQDKVDIFDEDALISARDNYLRSYLPGKKWTIFKDEIAYPYTFYHHALYSKKV